MESLVDKFLKECVCAGQCSAGGISSFKVVCDTTNNTSETVQQDIINASISCVPVGTIEQINIDCSLDKSSESVSVA